MSEFATILDQVAKEGAMKRDLRLRLQDTLPVVEKAGVQLNVRDQMYSFTKTGLTSFLKRINVPAGFFNDSSPRLQQEILNEHFHKNSGQSVLLRTRSCPASVISGQIRFVGSMKYAPYDDQDMMFSLSETGFFHELTPKSFVQEEDYTVLRCTLREPVVVANRSFYVGLNITNSEVGLSPICVSILLYEQVCTNGLILPRGPERGLKQRHIGRGDTRAIIPTINWFLSTLPEYQETLYRRLIRADHTNGHKLFLNMRGNKDIPGNLLDETWKNIPKYQAVSKNEVMSGLDVISAFTETIQRYEWDRRIDYEEKAGKILMDLEYA